MPIDWSTIKEGTVLPSWTAPPLTRMEIVRYQGASGDFDPAHHDDEHARRFGYPGVFSLGMLHAGVLSGWLARHAPPDKIRRFRARFVAVAYPGDVLTYKGRIAAIRQAEGSKWADFEMNCERADGTVVTQAWASVLIS